VAGELDHPGTTPVLANIFLSPRQGLFSVRQGSSWRDCRLLLLRKKANSERSAFCSFLSPLCTPATIVVFLLALAIFPAHSLSRRFPDPHVLFGPPCPAVSTMDQDHTRRPSPAPVNHAADAAPSPLDFIAAIKDKIDDIERQRGEASTAMRDRLHAAVVEYKQADQRFVDEHAACLNMLLACVPEASAWHWAKPCLGVPDRELFALGGIVIKYHPTSDPSGLGPLTRGVSPSPPAQPSFDALIDSAPADSPFSSTLSSAPPSPVPPPDLEISRPTPMQHAESTRPLLPSYEPEFQPEKRPADGTSSSSSSSLSDELAFEPRPPPRPRPKKRLRSTPDTPPAVIGRELRPTSRQGHPIATETDDQLATTATNIAPPVQKNILHSRYKCTECSKRGQACDRRSPCSICIRKGWGARCRYPAGKPRSRK